MQKKSKKKKPIRSKIKNASLNPNYNSKIRQEYLDYDYLNKLSEDELKWLADFTKEWNNASVGSQKDAKNNRFHNTPEMVKDCTDRNNRRNRCAYGNTKAQKTLKQYGLNPENLYIRKGSKKNSFTGTEDFKSETGTNRNKYEDELIDFLDYLKKFKDSNNDT